VALAGYVTIDLLTVGVKMSARQLLRSPLTWTIGGLGAVDVAVAALLSFYAVALVSGLEPTHHRHGGVAASVAVLVMTAPVAWRRRWPLAAAAVLAVGAAGNVLLFGSMVRCGAALPAVFLVGFTCGARSERARPLAGLGLCAVNVSIQCASDPQLGLSALGLMLPVLGGFYVTGLVARSRSRAASQLQQRSAELRQQRAQTAQLAVQADRARMSEGLESTLQAQIGQLASTAASGLDARDDPAQVGAALESIEHGGRDALRQLRDVLGTLHQDAPSEPQPTLAQLPELLARATTADARMTTEGTPRALPAGLELSGYRIIEHLLAALADAPGAAVEVCLRFTPEALEMRVSGPPAPGTDPGPALAAAGERAGLHGGTVSGRSAGGLRYATARLPLISGHA
jgi:signal transduction histidine kinase